MNDMELGASLEMAEQTLRSAASELANAFRAKGYPQASVTIEVRATVVVVTAHSGGPKIFKCVTSFFDWESWHGKTALEAYTTAASAISLVELGNAYDDEFRAPLFLMSEQHQEAAE